MHLLVGSMESAGQQSLSLDLAFSFTNVVESITCYSNAEIIVMSTREALLKCVLLFSVTFVF